MSGDGHQMTLTAHQVAKVTDRCVEVVRRWCASGMIRATKHINGRDWEIPWPLEKISGTEQKEA